MSMKERKEEKERDKERESRNGNLPSQELIAGLDNGS